LRLYVINLDRSPDRLAHVTQVFKELGLEFTRVAAVDGRALSDEEFAHWTKERNWPKALTRPEVGCFLSHRECLRLGVEQGDPYFAIFEDDILLSSGAPLFLRNDDWIENGTDIVKLDTAEIDCWLEPLRKSSVESYRLGHLISKHYCAGGYIVSREAAQRLLTVTEQAFAPIDEIYFNPDCGFLQTVNVQQLVPAPVIQAGLKSTIRQPPALDKNKHKRVKKTHTPRPFSDTLKREVLRFYRRHLRPIGIIFWYKWLKGYYWGKVPFG